MRAIQVTYHTIKEAGDRKFVLAIRAVTHTVTLQSKVHMSIIHSKKTIMNQSVLLVGSRRCNANCHFGLAWDNKILVGRPSPLGILQTMRMKSTTNHS